MEKKENKKTVIEQGSAKIILDDKKVEIIFGNKKVIYYAKNACREYANYSMILQDPDSQETKDFTAVLVGIEMMSLYAHSDANLAAKLYDVIVDDFTSKLSSTEARGDSDEENENDAKAVLQMQVSEMLSK